MMKAPGDEAKARKSREALAVVEAPKAGKARNQPWPGSSGYGPGDLRKVETCCDHRQNWRLLITCVSLKASSASLLTDAPGLGAVECKGQVPPVGLMDMKRAKVLA